MPWLKVLPTESLRDTILNEINTSDMYSLILDSKTDVTKSEQFTLRCSDIVQVKGLFMNDYYVQI